MGDGPVMLLLSFGVLRQFASQPSKWEHQVALPGQCNPIWAENFMEETRVLPLNGAAQRCWAEQCRYPNERGRTAVGRTVVRELAEGWERYDTRTRVLKMCSLLLPLPELIF